jgi:predicted RNA-binding Zn-ribbon protein involved in translation (DUF1610 family)
MGLWGGTTALRMDDNNFQYECKDCGLLSPKTNGNFTFLSLMGWRLFIRKIRNEKFPEWRCPQCWELFKKNKR